MMRMETPEGLLLIRATINLPGLRRGEQALVDPEEEYIAECLASGVIVVTDAEMPAGVALGDAQALAASPRPTPTGEPADGTGGRA